MPSRLAPTPRNPHEARLISLTRWGLRWSAPTPPPPLTHLPVFTYFKRGLTIYWHENPSIVAKARLHALDAMTRGFPSPSELHCTYVHPTRLGYAWHVSDPKQMG